MRGETIIVTRSGQPTGADDEQGNPVIGPNTMFLIPRCLLAPRGSDESAETFGPQTKTAVQVYTQNAAPDLRPTDRITFWGLEWHMEGFVAPWRKGRLMGSEFTVRRAA